MSASCSINKLACDSNARSGFSNRAFKNVPDAQLSPNLPYVHCPPLVCEGRVTGDYEERFDLRKRRDQLLDDAISKILLLCIAAHILEWQDGNRRLLWSNQR